MDLLFVCADVCLEIVHLKALVVLEIGVVIDQILLSKYAFTLPFAVFLTIFSRFYIFPSFLEAFISS
jgi:hypothetical protein